MSRPTVTTIERREPARSETEGGGAGDEDEEEEEGSPPESAAVSLSLVSGRLGTVRTNSSLLNRSDWSTLYLLVKMTWPPRESVALPNQAVNSRRSSLEGCGEKKAPSDLLVVLLLSDEEEDEADGGGDDCDDCDTGPREGAVSEELIPLLQLLLVFPLPLPLPLPPPRGTAPLPPLTSAASAA